MKASRYQQPDRHLEQDMQDIDSTADASDHGNNMPTHLNPPESTGASGGGSIAVDVGHAMPPVEAARLPLLQPQVLHSVVGETGEAGQLRSLLAEGMHFVGNAILRGPLSVAGRIDGNLQQAENTQTSVVVTETGRVKGDITAHKISVMGHTDGILDSGHGEIALHDSAEVHGLVRYGRIQVNGANLNATLERVSPRTPSP